MTELEVIEQMKYVLTNNTGLVIRLEVDTATDNILSEMKKSFTFTYTKDFRFIVFFARLHPEYNCEEYLPAYFVPEQFNDIEE